MPHNPTREPLNMPPLMPWRVFANWIGMSNEHATVKSWIDKDLIPSIKIENKTLINLLALEKALKTQDD